MGANYDIILSRCGELDDFIEDVAGLAAEQHSVDCVLDLADAEILDERALLVGVPRGGWIQVLAGASGLSCPLDRWFDDNPVGRVLSQRVPHCIHVWSLNSGHVAGYSLFESGIKRECAVVFAKSARNRTDLMLHVPVPARLGGGRLGEIIGQPGYDFSTDVGAQSNLEMGVARFMSKFGFPVHLVDFFDATDDKLGSAVVDGSYHAVPLTGWKAVLFH